MRVRGNISDPDDDQLQIIGSDRLQSHDVVGPAGTGKTFTAASRAIKLLAEANVPGVNSAEEELENLGAENVPRVLLVAHNHMTLFYLKLFFAETLGGQSQKQPRNKILIEDIKDLNDTYKYLFSPKKQQKKIIGLITDEILIKFCIDQRLTYAGYKSGVRDIDDLKRLFLNQYPDIAKNYPRDTGLEGRISGMLDGINSRIENEIANNDVTSSKLIFRKYEELDNSDLNPLVIFLDEAQSSSKTGIETILSLAPIGSEKVLDIYFDPRQFFYNDPLKDNSKLSKKDFYPTRTPDIFRNPAFNRSDIEDLEINYAVSFQTKEFSNSHRFTNPIFKLVDSLQRSGVSGEPSVDLVQYRAESGAKPRIHIWVDDQGHIQPANTATAEIDNLKLLNFISTRIQNVSNTNIGSDIGVVCMTNIVSEDSLSFKTSNIHDSAIRFVDENNHLVEHYENGRRHEIRSGRCIQHDPEHDFDLEHLWVISEKSARGLEFTNVIIPNAFSSTTNDDVFVRGLYIACSRAYRSLDIITDIGLVGADEKSVKRENMLYRLFESLGEDIHEYFSFIPHPYESILRKN